MRRVALAAFAAAMLVAGGANADIMTATVNGTANGTFVLANPWGLSGTLSNLAFTAVFTYDTTGGTLFGPIGRDGGQGALLAGSVYENPGAPTSPITGATLTLNGITSDFHGDSHGTVFISPGNGGQIDVLHLNAFHSDNVDGFPVNRSLIIDAALPVFPPNLTYQYTGFAADLHSSANFVLIDNHLPSGQNFDVGTFNYSSISIVNTTNPNAPIASIPEPASWVLMIAGFGLTGAAMRRRRRGILA